MNIYNVFTAFVVVFIHLLQTNDHRSLAPLLEPPVADTTYSICYIITPPSIPFTIDPSPPVLAPPFDSSRLPLPPHTSVGATSAGCDVDSFSVDWTANVLMVIIFTLIVHEAVSWLIVCIREPISFPSPYTPPSSPFWSLTDGSFPEYVPESPNFNIPSPSPCDDSYRVVLSSHSFSAPAAPSIDTPIPSSVSVPIGSDIPHMLSVSSIPNLHSSSSLSDEKDRHSEVLCSSNSDSRSIADSAAARSVRNFLDEISLALSPSPSFVIRTPPPVVPRIPRDLWEDLVDPCFDDKPSVWDSYPQTTPRTPVDLDDEVIEVYDESTSNCVEPLVYAWTIDAEETPETSTSTAQDTEAVKPLAGSTGSSRLPLPAAPARIPRLATNPAWKKTINALISGNVRKATRSVTARTSATSDDTTGSFSSLPTTPSKPEAPKKDDWFEDVEHALFTPEDTSTGGVTGATPGVKDSKRVTKTRDRVLETCNCALENALFEPKSWNKFKIPASCHPRPSIHFFAPRDSDASGPSTRIVVDNINAFPHHSTEPNVPYANKDIEDLFYPVGAKNVRCFDGRVVGGVVRYNTSYAVVDFQTIGDAEAAFKMLQGRKAYPHGYHLRLKYVDVNDRTFGRRMAVAMGPMGRSEEERRGFAELVEDLDMVDVDLAKVVVPSRPGFTLPARPVTPSEL